MMGKARGKVSNVLVHLCDISNLNYQQVMLRNLPSAMLMNGKLSQAKPVSPSPSSGFSVQRAFPIVNIKIQITNSKNLTQCNSDLTIIISPLSVHPVLSVSIQTCFYN